MPTATHPDLVTLTALAEPHRLAIVDLLRDGPRSVGDIAQRVQIAQPHASRHLKILAEAGLVSARRQAQSRIYRLERGPFSSLETWLDSFAQVWSERTNRLDDYVSRLTQQPEGEAPAGARP